MKHNNVPRLFAISLVMLILASACAGGTFTIEDGSFKASNACDGEGTLEWRMQSGKVAVTARGNVQTFMRQAGMPSAWCNGLRHVWIGEVTHAGYTFESSSDNPLQFVVDSDKGYYYEQGTGTVTTPDGEVVTLP